MGVRYKTLWVSEVRRCMHYISLIWTNYQRKRFSFITVPHERECKSSFRSLIVTLSNNSITDVVVESASGVECPAKEKMLYIKYKDEEGNTKETPKLETFDYSEKLLLNEKFKEIFLKKQVMNWEMPLRSIIKNVKKHGYKKGLEQLYIVGSKDSERKDSFNQVKNFNHTLFFCI